jgi:polar amino acid transport system substrate-binding protein
MLGCRVLKAQRRRILAGLRGRSRAIAVVVLTGSLLTWGVGASQAARQAAGKTNLHLVQAGYLSVGSDTTYPPMESKDLQHGGYKGADVDLAGALARAMGLKGARIVSTNFNSIIPALERRNFDVIMSSMNDTPDRRKQINFVDYMKLTASEAVVVPKNSSIHGNSYKALCGHTVSVESGTAELADLQSTDKSCSKKMTIKQYTADTDAFQALAAGHVDAYTTDLPVALYYVKQHSELRFAGKAIGSSAKYGIGILKSNNALHAAVVAALKTIHKNGRYMAILKKYGLSSTAM